jgi:hypothetical protein
MEIIHAPTRVLFVVEPYLLCGIGSSTRSTETTLKDILKSRIGKGQLDLRNDGSGLSHNVGFKVACHLDPWFLVLKSTGVHHGAQGSTRLSTVNVNWPQHDCRCACGTRLVTVPPALIAPQVCALTRAPLNNRNLNDVSIASIMYCLTISSA